MYQVMSPYPRAAIWNVDVAPVDTKSTPQIRGMKKDLSAPLAMESQSVCEVPNTPVGPMPRRRDWGVDMAPTTMEATPQFHGAKLGAPVAMRAGTGDTRTLIVRMTKDASQGPCHTPQYEPRPCEQEVNDISVEEDRFSQIERMDPNKVSLFHTFLQQPPHTSHSPIGQINPHIVGALYEAMPMDEGDSGENTGTGAL